MNPKLLTVIVASVIGVGIFSAVMFTISEDESALNEQQIQESIQKEVSKSPKITGVHAQNICILLGLVCSPETSFDAVFDSSDGYIKFAYSKTNDMQYDFRIIDDVVEYKTNSFPTTTWMILDDNRLMWNDAKKMDETTGDDKTYVNFWQFSGDELGYYERWCNAFDGDWLDEPYKCGFKDLQDYNAAKKNLTQVLNPSIEGEQSKIFCEILHKECNERVVFKAHYDPRTDITYYTMESVGILVK